MSAENTDAMPDIIIQMDDQPLSHERDDSNSVQVVVDRTVVPVVVEQVNAVPDDDIASFVEVRDVEDENSNPKNVTGESDDLDEVATEERYVNSDSEWRDSSPVPSSAKKRLEKDKQIHMSGIKISRNYYANLGKNIKADARIKKVTYKMFKKREDR